MQRRKFDDVVAAVSADFSPSFQSGQVLELAIKTDGIVTAAGGGGVASLTCDAPTNLLGILELSHARKVYLRVDAIDLYHFDGLIHGRYGNKLAPTPGAGLTGAFALDLHVPFALGRIPRGMVAVDGITEKLYLRGKFGALTDYAATNVASLTSWALRAAAFCADNPVAAKLRPWFNQIEVDLATASADKQQKFDFDQPTIVLGFLVRSLDASAVGDARRPDGLIKGIRLERTGKRMIDTQIIGRWGELKNETAKIFGMPLAELKAGIVFLATEDQAAPPQSFGYSLFQNGDAALFHFDTNATVESEFTAITPAADDKAVVTCFGYTFNQ